MTKKQVVEVVAAIVVIIVVLMTISKMGSVKKESSLQPQLVITEKTVDPKSVVTPEKKAGLPVVSTKKIAK